MGVSYLVYVSAAKRGLSASDLETILEESRAYNADHDISGLLVFARSKTGGTGSFMQVLEGDAKAIEALRAKIFADPRHHTKVVIERGEKPARDFADWSMAFKSLSASDLDEHPAFKDLGEAHFLERCNREGIGGALRFLCEFWNAAG
jgi:hypothetical protein